MQNVYGFWVLLVIGTHAAAVLLLARCSPFQGQDRVWRKLAGSQANDARLLLACMAWPGIFASDATDRDGALPNSLPVVQSQPHDCTVFARPCSPDVSHFVIMLLVAHSMLDRRTEGLQRYSDGSRAPDGRNAALFTADSCTMQLLQSLWQRDIVGVAHFIVECFAMLDTPDDNYNIPSYQP